MGSALELADLFDEATGAAAPQQRSPSRVPVSRPPATASAALDILLNHHMPALLQSHMTLERCKADAYRVDGCIIGTGAADFTQGNTCYTLKYKDRTFQLIDVPGIEGDEQRFAPMVSEAVAKAHLVFYVNGTNKKPEKATAEKIRSYLRRGTQVCPVVNVRGNADAYEFNEDRIALESHGGASAALRQTVGVLETVLGQEVLLAGHCVQGLLGFSALAMNSAQRRTTIHPSRSHDLVIQQRNYEKHFLTPKAMFEFSQIQQLAEVLHAKLGTFKQDIIESNKLKVRELLAENLASLQTTLDEHRIFLSRVEPEFKKCREAIRGALQSFERLTSAGRKNLWSNFFNDMSDKADQIIADDFGENDIISSRIKKAFKARQDTLDTELKQQMDEQVKKLQDSLSDAMGRLIQDVRRVEFQQQIDLGEGRQKATYQSIHLSMDLGLKGWGAIALNIGSFATTGAGLGSFAGPVGTAIGAVAGAAVGLLISLGHLFLSKEKRIRKAQAQAQQKLDETRDEVMGGLPAEMTKLLTPLRKEVAETTLAEVDAIHAGLTRPLEIIERQINLMTNIKHQLEKMPHGTIQTVQR